jgi:hypothetical protein
MSNLRIRTGPLAVLILMILTYLGPIIATTSRLARQWLDTNLNIDLDEKELLIDKVKSDSN